MTDGKFTKLDAMALGADCNHCPLRNVGKLVPSVGPKRSDVAFVGEAPGTQEAREGRPFIGPSGRLLGLVANNVGIDKDEVFLSNACLCRAPDGGTPPKMAIAACRPRLLAELKQSAVETVVALGNSAALSLLGVDGVTKLRIGPGRSSPYPELAGVRILPTLHPAACLRQSDMFPSLVKDVGKIATVDNGPWDPPRYTVVDTPVEAIEALARIQERGGDAVVDIEVDIDKDTANDHADRYDLLCVGIYGDAVGGDGVVVGELALRHDSVVLALGEALRACNLINQHIMFDLGGLFPHVGALEGVADTMLASYALDERPGVHDLEQQAVEILGAPSWKGEIQKYIKGATLPELEHYHGYGRIPRPILYKYNAYDLKNTWDLWKYYEVALEKQGRPRDWPDSIPYEYKSLRELHDFLVEAGNQLMFLELNGIYVDWNYNLQLLNEYESSINVLTEQINKILIDAKYEPINPRSPQQVMRVLQFFHINAPNTNEDTLTRLKEQLYDRYGDGAFDNPIYNFADLLLKHRKEAKMYGTYVKGIRKRRYRGKIHANYRPHGTTTGRPASRNPNMLNIPRMKKIKKQFVPKPGNYKLLTPHNLFVQGDYKSAELRTVSWLAQDTYFREILNDPARDLFDELTPQLRPDLPPKAEYIDTFGVDAWGDLRVRIKAFVYGLNYGRKSGSIAMEYKIPSREAAEMAKNFFELIPEIVEWQSWVKKRVKGGHDLINPFGRHRRFHLITEENWHDIQNEALAFLPQSTASDICLTAYCRLRREVRGTGVILRNTVYDSILGDCPPDKVDWFKDRLEKVMMESAYDVVGDWLPFTVDVKVGTNWGEV